MSSNFLNVYKGSDSLKNYYDPDVQPPLPLVEIPDCLNPFREDGVRIYAKMLTMLPAHNVKSLPALNMLDSKSISGQTQRIIEYSSGSTVISMSILGRVLHGIDDTRAYLSNKTSGAKLRLMQFFGLDITLFGGPSQPEPLDPRGGIQSARREAEKDETSANPNQYENDANWQAHYRWTGPQILRQLPEINVFCAGMGTSGTMTGNGLFLKQAKQSITRIGVCTKAGDRVPGPRSEALLAPVQFPWKEAVDEIEHVGAVDSYTLSMGLSREGLICGPSSGFNLQGLYQFLEKRKTAGTLQSLQSEDGSVHCVFLCCDLPYQYMDEYFTKLEEDQFPEIHNKNLVNVDLYRYDEAWELSVPEAMARLQHFRDGFLETNIAHSIVREADLLIDLRKPADFSRWSLPHAINVPLETLDENNLRPFSNSKILEKQWSELAAVLEEKKDSLIAAAQGRDVVLVCYDGDTARIATSILRAKNIEAFSIRGGVRELRRTWDLMEKTPKTTELGVIRAELRELSEA